MQSSQLSVAELFHLQVKKTPKSTVIIDKNNKKYSYSEFLKRVLSLSSYLLSKGLRHGDRVAIISENCMEYLELEMAAAKIGIIVAAINWRLSDNEMKYCINLVKPKILFLSERYKNKGVVLSKKYIQSIILYNKNYEEIIKNTAIYSGPTLGSGEDILVILYTSGTTGNPKGAMISHRAFISRAMYCAYEYNIDKDDVFPAWAPMFHMASTDLAIGSVIIGGSIAFVDGFKSEQIIKLIKTYKLSWLVLMPGMIEELLGKLKKKKLSIKGIKVMGAMADLVPKKQIKEITYLLKTPYLNSFGSTETGMPPASAGLIPINKQRFGLSKIQSSFCQVKLENEKGMVAKIGEVGECLIKGPTLFSGYWNAKETNKHDFRGGWFHMGDLMKRNDNGTLDFVDRSKYLIKSGGENIYPAEIERVLLGSKNVLEAVVVKIKSLKWGEVPLALVSVDNNISNEIIEDDLFKLCRNKLAGYKQPKKILFIDEKDIPRSTTGKVQRHLVEEIIFKKFNIKSLP